MMRKLWSGVFLAQLVLLLTASKAAEEPKEKVIEPIFSEATYLGPILVNADLRSEPWTDALPPPVRLMPIMFGLASSPSNGTTTTAYAAMGTNSAVTPTASSSLAT